MTKGPPAGGPFVLGFAGEEVVEANTPARPKADARETVSSVSALAGEVAELIDGSSSNSGPPALYGQASRDASTLAGYCVNPRQILRSRLKTVRRLRYPIVTRSVPATIKATPEAITQFIDSPRNIAANNTVSTSENLSTGATCEARPSCRARK